MSKYTEDTQVEQPAIDLFDDLDWDTLNAYEEELAFVRKHPDIPDRVRT